jgi:hypothetical protein
MTSGQRVRVAAVLAACHLSALAASAHAASPITVAIDYEIAPASVDCPDLEAFRASVRRQLGYDPFRPEAERRVAVQISRRESGFSGRIRWSDAQGNWVGDRRLSTTRSDCAGIAASVAFSVAVQVQLMAALAPASPEPVVTPPAPPSPAPIASAPDATNTDRNPTVEELRPEPKRPPVEVTPAIVQPVPPRRAQQLTLSVGLGPSIAFRVAPQATGVGRFFVRGGVGPFSVELGGDAALPVSQNEAGASGFSLDRFSATAAACGHVSALAACVTGTLGRLQAHGFGVDQRASPVGYFSQAGARVMATHSVGESFFATARVDGLIMVSPSTVMLNDVAVWTTPRICALLGFDLGARFF